MNAANKGFEPDVIQDYHQKMTAKGQNYLIIDSEDNSDEYVNFYFIGMYEGKKVIYDAVIYTLKLHYNSELYELAEHRAAQHFPNFKKIKYEEDENGDLEMLDAQEEEIGLFMAEVIGELEDEGQVKVQEHIEIDPHLDFGVGLDVALNVDVITSEVINDFIKKYNEDTLRLDDTLYTFETEEAVMN